MQLFPVKLQGHPFAYEGLQEQDLDPLSPKEVSRRSQPRRKK